MVQMQQGLARGVLAGLLACVLFLITSGHTAWAQADDASTASPAPQTDQAPAEQPAPTAMASAGSLSITRCRGDHARVKDENGESAWIALSELRVVAAPGPLADAQQGPSFEALQRCEAELAAVHDQMSDHASAAMGQMGPASASPSLIMSLGLVLVGILLGLIIASLRGARL